VVSVRAIRARLARPIKFAAASTEPVDRQDTWFYGLQLTNRVAPEAERTGCAEGHCWLSAGEGGR